MKYCPYCGKKFNIFKRIFYMDEMHIDKCRYKETLRLKNQADINSVNMTIDQLNRPLRSAPARPACVLTAESRPRTLVTPDYVPRKSTNTCDIYIDGKTYVEPEIYITAPALVELVEEAIYRDKIEEKYIYEPELLAPCSYETTVEDIIDNRYYDPTDSGDYSAENTLIKED